MSAMAAQGGWRHGGRAPVPLVLKAGQLPRLDTASDGVLALQERWPESPRGSEEAWARAGFEVVGRRWEDRTVPPGTDPSRWTPRP